MALTILSIWLVPMLVLFFWLGSKAMPFRVGLFFGKVAVLSFGGAYAALSYVSLHASGDWGWLSSGEMMDGLGLAETTPGPLLIALQFVAFLGCYKAPGILPPLLSATLGSLAAIWSLFLPSFLWIFSLAPHLEGIARNPRMGGALAAIGAVVTAVIIGLVLWFSEALFLPAGRFAALPLVLALLAFLLLQTKKLGVVPIILTCGLLNVLISVIEPSF
jgi:chromate transporter